MKRTVLIAILMLALASLLLVAMQCDGGGTNPVPTQSPQPPTPGSSPAASAYPSGGTASPTPEAYPVGTAGTPQGEVLLNERCTKCHDLGRVMSASKTAEEWRITVTRMRGNGADLEDSEATILIEYLSTKYGK